MIPNQLIIIGGGTSIKEGIEKGLWDKLKGKFTFGLNYSYKFFDSTVQFYVDQQFYKTEKKNLKDIPLIIGNMQKMEFHPNTIMLPSSATYNRDINKGVYTPGSCGLFALTIGVYLNPKEIFLLGYDFGTPDDNVKDKDQKIITHFYQGDIDHRGVGKINWYNSKERIKKIFACYDQVKNEINIENVSLISKTKQFPKISYDQFFDKLDKKVYDQDLIRKEIQKIIVKVKGVRYG